MRTTIRDAEILARVTPLQVLSYLRARQWEQEKEGTSTTTWIRSQADETFEVLVPMDPSLRDYANRVAEILATLETFEGRPRSEVLGDLLSSQHDVLRIRSVHDRGTEGILPLMAGVALVERSRDLLLSAACAAVEPRRVFPTRKPAPALEYIERVSLGQTETGSFILKILSPVEPLLRPSQLHLFEDEQAPVDSDDTPFARKVTMVLMESVRATREAASSAIATGGMKPFEDAVSRGVSANLCEAVAGLQGETGMVSVELAMSWSPNRPLSRCVPNRVLLSPDLSPVLHEAGRMFRETSPLDDFVLDGFVVQLRREEHEDTGSVTVSGLVDGNLRKVQVQLGGAEYNLALTAHQDRLPISCEGELVKPCRPSVAGGPHSSPGGCACRC